MSLTKNPKDILDVHQDKLKKIKCALFDVDGILTDGRILYMGEEMGWNRFFNIYDGYGIKRLMANGIHVGIISGGDSRGLTERFIINLGIPKELCHFGNEDKVDAYEAVKKHLGLEDHEISYMGDEMFDIPLLEKVGFSASVPGASFIVQEKVDYVSAKAGGEGAGREVMDLILLTNNMR